MKEERSAFGKLLHEIFLDPKPKILQEQLAKEMGISASAISYMVNEETLGYDQTAYNNLYNMLKSLAKLGRSISEDQVRRLFEAIEKHPLSKSSQDALIARLKQELIIKQAYLTIWQTPLIGRERDIQAVLSKLRDEKIRFLTLVGLPGVGKTELARQIKKLTQENFTPMDFPALQEKTSAAEVLRQISEKLRDTDRQKRTLLILNNCELITDINEARVALYNLLDDNEQLIILATSRRARFSVKDEYEVLPLEVPRSVNESPEALQRYDAVKLFIESATRSEKTFTLTEQNARVVAAICQALDGLPLALLMAGSWVKELGVEGVYTRLLNGDLQKLNYDFPVSKRHITLDKLISASYNLLKKNEQTLFRRLGIFSGSVGVFGVRGSIKAVATICNLGDLPTDELHLINSLKALANHNLVIFADELTGIAHATIRDYALLKLLKDKDENAKINIKFLIYYLITFDKEALVFDSETESLKLREKSTEQTGSILQALAMRMQMIDLLLLNFLVLQP